jgi:hypothetical protein
MNTKSVLGCAVVAAVTLTASVALAASHSGGGGSRGAGFSGGGARGSGSARNGVAPARSGTNFGRFRPGVSGNFRNFRGDRFRHRHFNDNDFFFFGDPFFYPFGYGYYPYGYYPYGYYPYGYYPPYGYGNGYGNGVYGQSGYEASSVVNIQRRLARAGYYHGRIDGVMGPRTREAMRAYQRSHGARVSQR